MCTICVLSCALISTQDEFCSVYQKFYFLGNRVDTKTLLKTKKDRNNVLTIISME